MFLNRRVAFAALAVLLVAGGIFYGLRPRGVKPVFEMYDPKLAMGTEMPVFYVETDRKAMALTFDISWGDKTPEKVLDVLSQHNQKATFFLSGPWANHYKSIVSRIVQDGHEIASHGQEHVNLSQESKEQIKKNIQSAHDILINLTDTEPRYFRPPNGDYDDLVVLTARELGYETVIWAVDSLDWKNPGASYIVERVSRLSFPGAILLFHASDSAKQTHEALPMVLENLKAAGYEIMTLGELMSLGKPARDDPRGRPLSELPGN
ncbi:MAG TPA: polysaccharide deacetylase family protein [Firmicutes bacterium]|jgi:polysaccharide deacetylase family sporulation protein PdaB|nr:polysaccharide deacetylase family protein [Candidatus Fermentithermobacillaceae bacterium]